MAQVSKSAIVPFSDRQMFELVRDVDRYKEFLPWCVDSTLLSEEGNRICGRIDVERMGIRQSFSTCNICDVPRRMDIELQEGPFKSLHGAWEFAALRKDASKVSLIMEFEFSGRLISAAFGTVFSHIANNLVDAFCKRAQEVYRDDR